MVRKVDAEVQGQPPTRVLIVFEEVFVRTIVRLALRREGYLVHEAVTPADAARLWYQHAGEIDVAIVDEDAGGETSRAFVDRLGRADPKVRVLFASRESDFQTMCGVRPALLRKPSDLAPAKRSGGKATGGVGLQPRVELTRGGRQPAATAADCAGTGAGDG